MKKLAKAFSVVLAIVLSVAMLTACGGGGGSSSGGDSKYEGKYIPVACEMAGITLTGDEITGFDMELQSGGKGSMTIDGDTASIKWKSDGTNLTLTISGEDIVGTLGEDTIKFEDMLGMGMDITFAKEGSDAANPENYYPEDEKNLIGTWKSHTVTDVLGDDASGEVAADALTLEFNSDKTGVMTFNGESVGPFPWSIVSNFGSFDDDSVASSWEFNDDGELEFTYSEGDLYYIFTCSKE